MRDEVFSLFEEGNKRLNEMLQKGFQQTLKAFLIFVTERENVEPLHI